MNENQTELDILCINTIRCLAIDAIQKANSGHPGAPMGIAPVAYTLWTRFLRHNPGNPRWAGRDRFVLSAGHASMLLYGLLHLTGYDISLDDIKRFRQLGSKTPGHPEYDMNMGVEVTTGPLGQGISNAVGMALARELVGARFNRPGFDLTDYYIYVICSDGDLMEGVSHEACSLAGHLKLGHLICLYDDNHITIEGSTDLTFTEKIEERFQSYGWQVSRVDDANDLEEVTAAIESAREHRDGPSLIMIRSRIACGSPNLEDCAEAHGSPLGEEEVKLTKKNLNFPEDPTFFIPDPVKEYMGTAQDRGKEREKEWNEMFASYREAFPKLATEWDRVMSKELPGDWEKELPIFDAGESLPTRSAGGKILNSLAPVIPELIGGSADLAPSCKTYLSSYDDINAGHFKGRNLHFGIREHAMGAILSGMALHGGVIPYGSTFLVFHDYMRPSVRLAAMMGLRVIYIYTHDSIGLGEDGPTHQPVEQIAALRSIPNLTVIRPADANETAEAWRLALQREEGPTALVLTRQSVPVIDREKYASQSGLERGAYMLAEAEGGEPEIIIIGSGSEVQLALEARERLQEKGFKVRVVSMPSWELFEEQDDAYRELVLPSAVPTRLAIEAGVPLGWHRYVGSHGDVLAVERFGLSAPSKDAFSAVGLTVENVISRAVRLLEGQQR